MNADLFIKAVLFLHRYLSSCSADQLRYVRHLVYHKMLTTEDPYEHLWDWLTPYRSRGNGWFLPRLEKEYIVHLLVYVDKFYRKAEWDAIDQACQKLSEIYVNDEAVYDKYAEFFGSYSHYYGDDFRRRCLLRNSQPEEN